MLLGQAKHAFLEPVALHIEYDERVLVALQEDIERLAFGKRISDLIDRGRTKILLDLGGVTYIDSSGVGMLAFQLKTVKQSGGDMKLLHLNRRAESLLGMMKLLIVFESFQNEAAAVRSFGWNRDR